MTSECVGGPADGKRFDRPPARHKDCKVRLIIEGGQYQYDWVTLKYRFVPPRERTPEEIYASHFYK